MTSQWWEDPRLASPTLGVDVADEVHFPGYEGMPFRGKPYLFKEGETSQQPREAVKAHVDIFDLGKPEDLLKYEKIIQMIANGFAHLSKEDMQYDDAAKSWRIFIRWGEIFAYNPKETPGGPNGGVRETSGGD